MFTKIDHIGVATRSIDEALKVLGRTGPLEMGKRESIPAFQVKAVMVALGEAPIELIEPLSDDSGVAAFIEKRGEGLHHVAYRVENIDDALEKCRAQGFRLIDEKPRTGYADSRVAFIHPKGMLGILTELVEREPGRDKPPYGPAES